MRPSLRLLGAAAMLTATAAFAHSGVEDEDVKARMDLMKTIGMNMKTIGEMAKGDRAFDAATAQSAAATIAESAPRITDVFEPQAQDPASEALPAIWENWDDFAGQAQTLEAAAERAADAIETPEDLASAMRTLGRACGGCHEAYRE